MPKSNKKALSLPLSISQNYLTSKEIIRRLIRIAGLCKDDYVVEIGTGRGHITRELARVCAHVDTYEIDRILIEHVSSKINTSNVNMYCRDFLKVSLPKEKIYKIFANIPFSRTSEIIDKIITTNNIPEEAWLIMEKGAAKRFAGKPYDSRVSLILKPFYEINIHYHFKRDDFHPAPGVDVVLLCLKKKNSPDINFSQKRIYKSFVENQFIKFYYKKAKHLSRETLYIQWLCLFRRLYRDNKR